VGAVRREWNRRKREDALWWSGVSEPPTIGCGSRAPRISKVRGKEPTEKLLQEGKAGVLSEADRWAAVSG